MFLSLPEIVLPLYSILQIWSAFKILSAVPFSETLPNESHHSGLPLCLSQSSTVALSACSQDLPVHRDCLTHRCVAQGLAPTRWVTSSGLVIVQLYFVPIIKGLWVWATATLTSAFWLAFLGRANHWSAIIGGSHSKNYVLWEYGGYASEGVKQVAELGSPVKMEEEIRQQVRKTITE